MVIFYILLKIAAPFRAAIKSNISFLGALYLRLLVFLYHPLRCKSDLRYREALSVRIDIERIVKSVKVNAVAVFAKVIVFDVARLKSAGLSSYIFSLVKIFYDRVHNVYTVAKSVKK